jgi:hypothetical protein
MPASVVNMNIRAELLRVLMFIAVIILFTDSYGKNCSSWNSEVSWQEFDPVTVPPAKKAVEIAATTTVTSSVLTVGVTQVAQGGRAMISLQMLGCGQGGNSDVSWQDSPLGLTIGNDALSQYKGAVVGNWLIFVVITSIWKGAAHYLTPEKIRFPSGLIIPAMFLYTPIASSSMTLALQGNTGQKVLGGFSLALQLVCSGYTMLIFLPKYFHANWLTEPEGHWADAVSDVGYVKRNGLLFGDYTGGRQWFVGVEMAASLASGITSSYQNNNANCQLLLTTSALTSTLYAVAVIFLHPNRKTTDRFFYGTTAGVQALALVTQAIASWVSSEDTQNKIRSVTQPVVMATQYLLLAKSFYDIGMRAKGLFDFLKGWKSNNLPSAAHVEIIPTIPTIGDDASIIDLSHENSLSLSGFSEMADAIVPNPVDVLETSLKVIIPEEVPAIPHVELQEPEIHIPSEQGVTGSSSLDLDPFEQEPDEMERQDNPIHKVYDNTNDLI